MSTDQSSTPNPAEPTAPQPVGKHHSKRTMRERYGRNWLLRLSGLPTHLYAGAVARLLQGHSISSVARWLAGQKHRGTLSDVGEEALRKYLSILAEEVEKQKHLHPGPTIGDLQDSGLVAQPPPNLPLPGPPPLARRPGARFKSLEEYIGQERDQFDSDLVAIAAIKTNWEFLDRLRRAEEVMGEKDNPIPLHALAKGHAQASDALMKAIDQLNRNRDSRLKKELANLGDDVSMPVMPPEYCVVLDGNRINAEVKSSTPAASQTETHKQAESKEPEDDDFIAGLSRLDRMFAREYAESTLTALRLRRLQREQQSQQSAPASEEPSPANLAGRTERQNEESAADRQPRPASVEPHPGGATPDHRDGN